MFEWPSGPRKTLPGGSLKYLFVYLKVRIFKCPYFCFQFFSILQLEAPEGSQWDSQ